MPRGRQSGKKKAFDQTWLSRLAGYNVGYSWLGQTEDDDGIDSDTRSASLQPKPPTITGNCLVEMPLLASALEDFCVCSKCKKGQVELYERAEARTGIGVLAKMQRL